MKYFYSWKLFILHLVRLYWLFIRYDFFTFYSICFNFCYFIICICLTLCYLISLAYLCLIEKISDLTFDFFLFSSYFLSWIPSSRFSFSCWPSWCILLICIRKNGTLKCCWDSYILDLIRGTHESKHFYKDLMLCTSDFPRIWTWVERLLRLFSMCLILRT
jgi:hypothetical protein